MKVAINRCWGGFGLSDKAYEKLIEMGWTVTQDSDDKSAKLWEEIPHPKWSTVY